MCFISITLRGYREWCKDIMRDILFSIKSLLFHRLLEEHSKKRFSKIKRLGDCSIFLFILITTDSRLCLVVINYECSVVASNGRFVFRINNSMGIVTLYTGEYLNVFLGGDVLPLMMFK